MKNKWILIRLCLLGMLLLPASVQAQFIYTTNADNTITIDGYTSSDGIVMIPSTIDGLPVTSIGDWAFYATDVTNVLIPDSVTSIGDGAFFDCISLTNITIGSGVTSIGDWTFGFCSSLVSIDCRGNTPGLGGDNVFYGNAATLYYLPETTGWGPTFDGHPVILWNAPVPYTYTTNSDGITLTITGYTGSGGAVIIPSSINFLPVSSLAAYTFNNCIGLTSVVIPDSVTSIQTFVFPGCTNLTAITVGTGNSFFSSVAGVLFNYGQTRLIQFPEGKIGSYMIPSTVNEIWPYAFYGCADLTSVEIPEGVTSIGSYAFSDCASLTAITVDANNSFFSSIAGVLFDRNQTLLVQFPEGKVGIYTIPNTVTTIGDNAFATCTNLTDVMIPSSVTNIGLGAFSGCISLNTVSIPGGVVNIGSYAFSSCASLTNITIPNSLTQIGLGVFDSCSSLTSVTIPDSVTSIGIDAFGSCLSLTNIIIPNGVTNIDSFAFFQCISLVTVTIPNNVTNMGDGAFRSCFDLKEVFFKGNAPGILGSSIFDYSPNVTVYYLPGTTDWQEFAAQTGVPVVLWNPQPQTDDGNFGVGTSGFGFNIDGTTNIPIVVESASSLAGPWTVVQSCTLTDGSIYFSDPQWTNYPSRFYRIRWP